MGLIYFWERDWLRLFQEAVNSQVGPPVIIKSTKFLLCMVQPSGLCLRWGFWYFQNQSLLCRSRALKSTPLRRLQQPVLLFLQELLGHLAPILTSLLILAIIYALPSSTVSSALWWASTAYGSQRSDYWNPTQFLTPWIGDKPNKPNRNYCRCRCTHTSSLKPFWSANGQ